MQRAPFPGGTSTEHAVTTTTASSSTSSTTSSRRVLEEVDGVGHRGRRQAELRDGALEVLPTTRVGERDAEALEQPRVARRVEHVVRAGRGVRHELENRPPPVRPEALADPGKQSLGRRAGVAGAQPLGRLTLDERPEVRHLDPFQVDDPHDVARADAHRCARLRLDHDVGRTPHRLDHTIRT